MISKFYKGVLASDLKSTYIPGTVTKNRKEAELWFERIVSKKRHGPSRHIRHGEACIIEFEFDETMLLNHSNFQESGISEHSRVNCWTSTAKVKAQINIPIDYVILN